MILASPCTPSTLIPFQVDVEGREDDGFDLKEVPDEFQGMAYKRTGDWWSKVMLSPDKRLLTALTYTSPEKPERGHLIFGGGEPRRGEFFWDVYETGSGEKMASDSLTFSEITPDVISDTALWVDEKYLLLPLDEGAQSCLLIALPEN